MMVTVKRKLDRDIRNNYPFGERVRLVVHGDELRYHGSCLYRRLNRRRLHGRTAKVSTRRTEGNKLYVTLLLPSNIALYIFHEQVPCSPSAVSYMIILCEKVIIMKCKYTRQFHPPDQQGYFSSFCLMIGNARHE